MLMSTNIYSAATPLTLDAISEVSFTLAFEGSKY